MLKKTAFLVAAVALVATTLFAGDCVSGGSCANQCPLAQAANSCMATGHESLAVSQTVRKDFVDVILANLARI